MTVPAYHAALRFAFLRLYIIAIRGLEKREFTQDAYQKFDEAASSLIAVTFAF